MENVTNNISRRDIDELLKDRGAMIAVTRQSLLWFFYTYFGNYITHPLAPFHNEMFRIGEDESTRRAVVIAFRSSAKSSILNTANVLWNIIGIRQKKHVVIASQTQQLARGHLRSIRKEVEKNELLCKLLGPFRGEDGDTWNASTLVFPKYDARISAISVEEGIRGSKEGPHRPDLIIADDIENLGSVKTGDGRDKTFNWVTGELLPLGDPDTKAIFLGNYLHEDSALSRIAREINEERMKGAIMFVPLVNEAGEIAWPGKFPTQESVEKFRAGFGNEIAWQREFLLRLVPDAEQIIQPAWLKEYERMPSFDSPDYVGTYIGIDPAVSENEGADFTAIIIASAFGHGEKQNIYIHPDPVNKRMGFNEMKETIKLLARTAVPGRRAIPVIEDVAAQRWLYDEIKRKAGIHSELFKVSGIAKSLRLKIAAAPAEAGKVYFPKGRYKELREQLLGFGSERYDDLADAFSIVIGKILELESSEPGITGYYRKKYEEMMKTKKDPQAPGSLAAWKALADKANNPLQNWGLS